MASHEARWHRDCYHRGAGRRRSPQHELWRDQHLTEVIKLPKALSTRRNSAQFSFHGTYDLKHGKIFRLNCHRDSYFLRRGICDGCIERILGVRWAAYQCPATREPDHNTANDRRRSKPSLNAAERQQIGPRRYSSIVTSASKPSAAWRRCKWGRCSRVQIFGNRFERGL
jgi:hypothetical protein